MGPTHQQKRPFLRSSRFSEENSINNRLLEENNTRENRLRKETKRFGATNLRPLLREKTSFKRSCLRQVG
ncbi:hypothetical protein L596_002355 [Steinernema carpocapsae]|uniref:Uncharacterized protein n=1 Tax=Steinernema carpocapsae TaxID=34508 RepID=A0A4U8UPC8_STECR|nr:hypothetical protein L596_002355 [Steinernema carpocapsae]